MAVRYRPRGFDARPGRRVSYWFENDVTREKGIPPKISVGVVKGRGYDGTMRVLMDNAPLDNGQPYVASIPAHLLRPEDAPELAPYDHTFRDRNARHRGWPKRFDDAWWSEQERKRKASPINPDLLDRAIERYGPRELWRRSLEVQERRWKAWMAQWK